MASTDFSDELLMSFVDGEADESTNARIEAAIRHDADLADRVAMFAETRALAKDALDPLLAEPVPAALRKSVEDMIERHHRDHKLSNNAGNNADNIAALPSRSSQRAATPHWTLPLAASIAMIVAGAGGFWLGQYNSTQPQMLALGTVGNPALAQALDALPSGGERQIPALGELRVVSSFRDGGDQLCRELELTSSEGPVQSFVACRTQNGWATTFAVATLADADSYAPASSDPALDAYLTSIEASPPLGATEEMRTLGKEGTN